MERYWDYLYIDHYLHISIWILNAKKKLARKVTVNAMSWCPSYLPRYLENAIPKYPSHCRPPFPLPHVSMHYLVLPHLFLFPFLDALANNNIVKLRLRRNLSTYFRSAILALLLLVFAVCWQTLLANWFTTLSNLSQCLGSLKATADTHTHTWTESHTVVYTEQYPYLIWIVRGFMSFSLCAPYLLSR